MFVHDVQLRGEPDETLVQFREKKRQLLRRDHGGLVQRHEVRLHLLDLLPVLLHATLKVVQQLLEIPAKGFS